MMIGGEKNGISKHSNGSNYIYNMDIWCYCQKINMGKQQFNTNSKHFNWISCCVH